MIKLDEAPMCERMTSKERVLTTFARCEPDRVPIDYLANADIDRRLKQHFGLRNDDDDGLRQVLNVDFRGVDALYTGPKLHDDIPGMSVDDWGKRKRWIEHETGGYWEIGEWPLRTATMEEVEAWPMPSPDCFDYARVPEMCEQYGDYCIVVGGSGIGDIINSTGMIRTMDQVLVDLITDDPVGLRLIDRSLDIVMEIMTRTLEAGRGMIDLFWMGEDLGTQRGPTLSLELFRKHIRPRLQRFVDLARSWDLPVMMHSCGSSSWAFDDFIDMGITVIDTLQPEAKDMAPAYINERFGDRLAFHGMISTGGPVAYGSVDDVVANVRDILELMKPGGGYALSPSHSLQDNSPTENVLALYESALRYGRY